MIEIGLDDTVKDKIAELLEKYQGKQENIYLCDLISVELHMFVYHKMCMNENIIDVRLVD